MFSQTFSPCSLVGILCMFCEKICTISATLLTQKNNFLKNVFPELFPLLTRWHTLHVLRNNLFNFSHSMCVCVFVWLCISVCVQFIRQPQMSATFDKKKSFFQNCMFFSRNFFPLAHSVVHFVGFAEKSVQFQPHYWHKKIIFSKIKISVCTKCEISNIFDTQKVFLKFFPRTFPLAHSMAHYACFAKQSV